MKGTYVFIFKLKESSRIRIGKFGSFYFPKGYYYYVGSALGENLNIENRIRRYIRIAKEKKGNLKWHIDYLLVKNIEIKGFVLFKSKVEHKIARKLSKKLLIIVKGFGSSDCNCIAHLFYSKNFKNMKELL
jgi:endonuclease-3